MDFADGFLTSNSFWIITRNSVYICGHTYVSDAQEEQFDRIENISQRGDGVAITVQSK